MCDSLLFQILIAVCIHGFTYRQISMCLSPSLLGSCHPIPRSPVVFAFPVVERESPHPLMRQRQAVSRTPSLRTEPRSLSAEPVPWWQVCTLPVTHASTESVWSIPVLLKEWLSWLAEGGRIAICLMHVAVCPQETSSALVSR